MVSATRSAGYSGKPLAQKLGLKPGQRVAIIAGPASALAGIDAPGLAERLLATRVECLPAGSFDVLHAFFTDRAVLEAALPQLRAALLSDGMLWVSWPKKSAKLATDLTEDVIRRLAIAAGLVDVKVCAVDETWSGLKLVIPVRDRKR